MKFLPHPKFIIPAFTGWLFSFFSLTAQPFVLTHTRMLTGSRYQSITGLAALSDKELVAAGVVFLPGYHNGKQTFLLRFDTTGQVQTQTFFGGPGYTFLPCISASPGHGIFGILLFRDTLSLGDSVYLSRIRSGMIFFKTDEQGIPAFSRQLAGKFKGMLHACTIDSSGTFWAGGWFRKLSVGGQVYKSKGRKDAFLLKTTPSGEPQIFIFPGSGNEEIRDIVPDNHNILVAGMFSKEITVNDTLLPATGKTSIFLARFSRTGTLMDISVPARGGDINPVVIRKGSGNNLYAGGKFTGEIRFRDTVVFSRGEEDAFILKTDSLFNPAVLSVFGGTGSDQLTSLTTDSTGRLFLTAIMKGIIRTKADTLKAEDRYHDAIFAEADTANLTLLWTYHNKGLQEQTLDFLMSGKDGNLYLAGQTWGSHTLAGSRINASEGGIFSAVFTNPCKWLHFDMPEIAWLCTGEPGILDAGNYAEYFWTPGETTERYMEVSNPGMYQVLITDKYGCHDSATVRVVTDSLLLSLEVTDETIPPGNNGAVKLILTGGVGTATISWSTGDSSEAIGDLQAGSYTVHVTDSLGCTAFAEAEVGQQITSGIYDIRSYPNPFDEITRIIYSVPENIRIEISIYDISGKKLFTLVSAERKKGEYAFDWYRQDLNNGVYYLRISSKLGQISRQIVITDEF